MENNKYYVYVLMDSCTKMEWKYNNKKYYHKPFYIGMGSGYRINFHGSKKDLKSDRNDIKKNYISKILESGNSIIREKLIENLSSEKACMIEIDLIKRFGKIINNSGILTNLSNGGEKFMYGQAHPLSQNIYQYSIDGIFIKEYKSLVDIKIDGYKWAKESISTSSIKNSKTFPHKVHRSCGYLWFKDFKGNNITDLVQKHDNRIYQYSENFELINVYEAIKYAEKVGYSSSSIYYSISKKKLYKNSYWSLGKIIEKDKYGSPSEKCKKCYQYSKSGKFIKSHDCVTKIPETENINIKYRTICDACRDNSKYYPERIFTAGGFIWVYDYKGKEIIGK